MGFGQLRRDVAALQQKLQGTVQLVLEDSTVKCCFDECPAPISIVFFQPDEYPNSPSLVMCETSAEVSAQLQEVSDSFETGGALQYILELTCQSLNIGARFAFAHTCAAASACSFVYPLSGLV